MFEVLNVKTMAYCLKLLNIIKLFYLQVEIKKICKYFVFILLMSNYLSKIFLIKYKNLC